MEEKERHDEKGRLATEENDYGDHNKIEAQLTLLCTVLSSKKLAKILRFLLLLRRKIASRL